MEKIFGQESPIDFSPAPRTKLAPYAYEYIHIYRSKLYSNSIHALLYPSFQSAMFWVKSFIDEIRFFLYLIRIFDEPIPWSQPSITLMTLQWTLQGSHGTIAPPLRDTRFLILWHLLYFNIYSSLPAEAGGPGLAAPYSVDGAGHGGVGGAVNSSANYSHAYLENDTIHLIGGSAGD